jgi:hypothetical protein
MIVSIRRFCARELDASVERIVLRHPSFILRYLDYRGGIVEDRLLESPQLRMTIAGWPVLTVLLDGTGIGRDGNFQTSATQRELLWVPDGDRFRGRSGDGGMRALMMQWDPAVFGGPAGTGPVKARLGGADFLRIRAAAECIVAAGYDIHASAAGVARLYAVLRALGLVGLCPEPGDVAFSVPADIARTGFALDRALSNLTASPMLHDVEEPLACSNAQARRLMHRYTRLLQLPGGTTFRDLRNSWRANIGAWLMTTPGSDTNRVARLLGYGSAAAFCHACASAGLPSPGNIRRAVDALL